MRSDKSFQYLIELSKFLESSSGASTGVDPNHIQAEIERKLNLIRDRLNEADRKKKEEG